MAEPNVNDAESLRALAEATAVSEVMHQEVHCLSMDSTIDGVIEMFLDKDLAQAPVVDAAWRPLGMVSKNELLRVMEEHGAAHGQHSLHALTVREVAVPHVVTVHRNASLAVAAALMANEGLHALPIVAQGGEVIGVVSTLDVIRWLAQQTGMQGSEGL